MNNAKLDGLTKVILSGSKLEIINRDFNKIVMGKIKAENRKSIIYSNIKLYSLIFISIDAFIIILLSLMNMRISDISIKINIFSHVFGDLYSNFGQLIFFYFGGLLAIIFVLHMITSAGYSYSKIKVIE